MADQTQLQVACLGAGYFSQFHVEAWERNPRSRVIGIADRIVNANSTSYTSLEQMLDAVSPDILDIITPPDTHLQAIRTGIERGIKTIICQKPFCANLKQAREAVSAVEASNTTLIIHENFRFQPWYRTIKASIDNGDIGDVSQLTFRLRTGDGQGPNAYLDRQPYFQKMERFLVHETGVHWIDSFRFILGQPTAVYADLRRINPAIKGEDAGYILFDHPSGARSLFDGNRHLDHATEEGRLTFGEALVEGMKGTLKLNGSGVVTMRKFGESTEKSLLKKQQYQGFAGDCVYALQDHVIAGLLDGKRFQNEARDYLEVIEIEEKTYASAQANQKLKI